MPRYACLLIPDLPLASALRAEPELVGRPLAVVDEEAIVSGWLRGMTIAQARASVPDLVVRPVSHQGLESARAALIDVALSATPRVEEASAGITYLDLEGSEALFPSERGLLVALESRLRDVGLRSVRAGIGPTRTIAYLAARHDGGGHIVHSSQQRAFLDPLPLDLLDPADELWERLGRWGVRTLGDLARIKRPALGTRLGESGVALARRARGQDLAPFRPTAPRLRFEEATEPGYPIADLEALAFTLRGVLDRLTQRLRVRGLAVRELLLEFSLESGQHFARTVSLGAPTVEVPVLTSLIQSPPPTIEVASESATALATSIVPRTKGSISKAPIGPFQTIILAPAISSRKAAIVEGPMSRAFQSAGIGCVDPSTILV